MYGRAQQRVKSPPVVGSITSHCRAAAAAAAAACKHTAQLKDRRIYAFCHHSNVFPGGLHTRHVDNYISQPRGHNDTTNSVLHDKRLPNASSRTIGRFKIATRIKILINMYATKAYRWIYCHLLDQQDTKCITSLPPRPRCCFSQLSTIIFNLGSLFMALFLALSISFLSC